MIVEITYGYRVENVDDPFIRLADEAVIESARHGGPGATLCDILPMREFPHLYCATLSSLKRKRK